MPSPPPPSDPASAADAGGTRRSDALRPPAARTPARDRTPAGPASPARARPPRPARTPPAAPAQPVPPAPSPAGAPARPFAGLQADGDLEGPPIPHARAGILADWIRANYADAPRIVEVGVGRDSRLASELALRMPATEVVVTDRDLEALWTVPAGRLRAVLDDAKHPDLDVYRDASLLYCLRPPAELVPALEALADQVGADLLAVPGSDGEGLFLRWRWVPVVLYGRVLAWVRKPAQQRAVAVAIPRRRA